MRRVNDVMLAKVLAVGKTGVSTTLNAVREPYEAKVSSTVLRGPRLREEVRLPSQFARASDYPHFLLTNPIFGSGHSGFATGNWTEWPMTRLT
jgi:hypothetical protein